ncbi:olfactory receptor 6B1-like [Pelobates fuscus]|uniref:olfactory receptor 6B1-like n=1 Tax=Pelobates fuscus TaxID=191477 RepID=UPI002FE486A2
MEQARQMVESINELPTPVRMTAEISTEKVIFLDVELSVTNKKVEFSLYTKPTDRNTILHYTSAHPRNLKNSIPQAQFLRVMRNNSKDDVRQQQLEQMRTKFVERVYGGTVLDAALEKAQDKATKPQDALKRPALVFPITFHNQAQKVSNVIKKNWNMLSHEDTLPNEFREPPRICFRRNRNLKDMLMKTDPVESYTKPQMSQIRGCLYYIAFENMTNQTHVSEFIIIGFTNVREFQLVLFAVFLLMYILTFTQHAVIIVVIHLDYHLHTPMYFFLVNLSFLDISYVTVTVPRMLFSFISGIKTISVNGCFFQLYIFFFLGTTECFLLTAMAYDRYLAICDPLHYNGIMDRKACIKFAGGCWSVGFLAPVLPTTFTYRLSYCGSNVINHFFCDSPPILKLSCQNIHNVELINFVLGSLILLTSFLLTMISYFHIISTILKIPTADGRQKAFSTCASHLSIVIMFYGTTIFTYVRPRTINAFNFNKTVSLIYAVITPMINPIIYSLRNNDIRQALKKVIVRI